MLTLRQRGGYKLPYLGVNYLRGVQGESIPIGRVGDGYTLSFDADIEAPAVAGGYQWVQVWFFFRYGDGVRMYRQDLFDRGYEGDFDLLWNWPAVNSYYYPGARLLRKPLMNGVSSASGNYRFDVDVLASYFDDAAASLKPEFLGFEIAVEQGYRTGTVEPLSTSLRVRSPTLSRR
jgi:hypothetical protein